MHCLFSWSKVEPKVNKIRTKHFHLLNGWWLPCIIDWRSSIIKKRSWHSMRIFNKMVWIFCLLYQKQFKVSRLMCFMIYQKNAFFGNLSSSESFFLFFVLLTLDAIVSFDFSLPLIRRSVDLVCVEQFQPFQSLFDVPENKRISTPFIQPVVTLHTSHITPRASTHRHILNGWSNADAGQAGNQYSTNFFHFEQLP